MPIVDRIRACRDCAATLEPNPIVQLDPAARILIASQAPGRVAHESGVPFMDASGRRLREWLGISESRFYDPSAVAIVPMAFCFPGSGRQGDLAPPPACAARWRAEALAELAGIRLTLLVGQYAQRWHLGEDFVSLTDSVTRWREFAPSVFPLPHPSPRNTPWLRRHPWFESALLPSLKAQVQTVLE